MHHPARSPYAAPARRAATPVSGTAVAPPHAAPAARAARTVRAAALLLPALLLAAACTSGGGARAAGSAADGPNPGTTGAATSPAPGGASATRGNDGALTRTQLAAALVTTKDVPGWVIESARTDESPRNAGLTTDRSQCQPLTDVTSVRPHIHRVAVVGAAFAHSAGAARVDTVNQMLVSSHAPGDAAKVIASVQDALATCRSFTAVDPHGTRTPFTVGTGAAPAAGDQAVSYVLTERAGTRGAARVTVVRTGNTVTAYLSVTSAGRAGEAPGDVIRAQDAKLRAAQVRH